MASARQRRRQKQYEELARENAQLHQDVEDLETAFFLHRQVLEEEEDSIRGMIRKEIGGSRWEYGGTGKLTTYKSRKDLEEPAGKPGSQNPAVLGYSDTSLSQNMPYTKRENHTERKTNIGSNSKIKTGDHADLRNGNHTLLHEMGKTKINDLYDEDTHPNVEDGDSSKILDLKTKVLKKASSKVIHRDNWGSPNRQTESKLESNSVKKFISKVSKDLNTHKAGNRDSPSKRNVKPKSDAQKYNKKSGTFILDQNETEALLHETCKQVEDAGNAEVCDTSIRVRHSRKDLHDNKRETVPTFLTETSFNDDQASENSNFGFETLPSKENILDKRKDSTEIFIDPDNAQVRVRSVGKGAENVFSEAKSTKILIQGECHGDVEIPQSFKFSITENNKKKSVGGEIRDVLGLLDTEEKSDMPNSIIKSAASLSPFALTKDCDTEVEFWLRGLDLVDVEEYVKMFAENEIDLLDLEFMSAAQLHDMGVTDTEALNILLNGVSELRNLPPDKGTKFEQAGIKRGLQATSIAWEETSMYDPAVKTPEQRFSERNSGKTDNSELLKNKTYTKGRNDSSKSGNKFSAEMGSNRSDSAMSNNSFESTRSSNRNQNSFSSNAQSRAGNKNQKSQSENADTRASAKPNGARANKLPPNSKSQMQKKTVNTPNKKQKTQDQASESKSRLQALETRPTRSVLLKRSASLTRETGRGQNRKTKSEEESESKRPAVRGRSRSAEAVKRKALEGVQAAAKRHEERQMKGRENEEAKNKVQERRKAERDEMAARHLQREKKKAPMVSGTVQTKEKQSAPPPVGSPDLESLVTVNIISQKDKREIIDKVVNTDEDKSKTRVITPATQTRKSLRRIEPGKKSVGKTAMGKSEERLVNSDYEVPLLSTYKLETKTREGASSEPESGYKTDNSTTYTQVEEKVAEIQLKIKRLKSRATSGDEVTLTLVKDLQTELQHFEKLLTEKEKSVKIKKPEKDAEKGGSDNRQTTATSETGQNQPKPSPRKVSASLATSSPASTPRSRNFSGAENTPRQENSIEDLLIEDSVVKGGADISNKAAMSMSKKELLDEMRKEKHQHHKQIRQLQSELKRMRETDAASTLELNHSDIVYREEDLVGEGAFSQVFRGTYQGAEVAIKRLAVPLATQDRNYFAAEVSLLRELRHPRVVLLLGVCTSDRLPLMVLEFMSGGSLYNHLHSPQSEPLDHAEYYQVARDIALGMNYLHNHKPEVLHLDLKSVNVLLCQSFRAKIADFGFSKLRHDATAKLKKGKGRQARGSPAWMAPEMIDKGEITCKADIYSFAIILWEMLTRQLPYENASVFQILEMVRKNKRPEIPMSCPEGLNLLIARCWDQNPARRPHFRDIVSSLENLAFPPAWRELFRKAGVPEEALHNIESTRTLINLVTTTLDSESFSTFMIPDPKREKVSSGEASSDSSEETASTCVPRKTIPKESDDWESGTVSDITEIPTEQNSEFSLGILRDSCNESSSESTGETITESHGDESSSLSSDEDSIVLPISSRRSPCKKLNVFVPSLQLSVKSPITEPTKEEKPKFDWVSISLEDRSYKEDEIKQTYSPDRQTVGQNLSARSYRSNGIVTPVSPMGVTSSRENERKSWQEKAKEMDEYLMRESINNRRPTSPVRKRLSLTKKLAAKSVDTGSMNVNSGGNEDYNQSRMAVTDRLFETEINSSSDLASLNKKLADLNSKSYEPLDNKLPDRYNGQFRKLEDTTALPLDQSGADDLSCEENRNFLSNKSTRKIELFNEKSYDSFYNLPVNKIETDDGAFRKSESALPRGGSFSKSKAVLDMLSSQIKHTARTLEEMEQDSCDPKSDFEVNRNNESFMFKDELSESHNAKLPIGYSEVHRNKISRKNETVPTHSDSHEKLQNMTEAKYENDKIKEMNPAIFKSVAENYKSRNIFVSKSDLDDEAKELLRQKHLDDYRKFLKQEILHDSGGSIENLRATKGSESETSEKNDPVSDHSDDTTIKIFNEEKDVKEVNNFKEIQERKRTEQRKGNESEETDVSKEDEEEKEEIRVILNPSDVVSRKPVKTPRRSKMKEKEILPNSIDNRSLEESKSLIDELKLNENHSKSMKTTDLSKEEALKRLMALEEFSKIQLDNENEKSILSASLESQEKVRPPKGDSADMFQETFIKSSNSGSQRIEKHEKELEKNHSRNKTQKVKLLPKEEHWTKLPEKPKKAAVNEGPNEDSKSKMSKKMVSSESKTQSRANIPKALKADLSEKPKKMIRVKIKKDPLVPVLSECPPSPVPPAPPSPPVTSMSVSTLTFSKSVQVPKPAASMADELKLRVASWQSRSFQRNTVKSRNEAVMNKNITQSKGHPGLSKKFLDSVAEDEIILEDSLEDFDMSDEHSMPHKGRILIPKLSEGLPEFAIQSLELKDQKEHLKSISKPHPDQLDDLGHVSKEQLLSIAELLRKAVMERRLALGEDSASVDMSVDSVSWSVETTPRP